MIDLDAFKQDLLRSPLAPHAESLCNRVSAVIMTLNHGDQPRWEAALNALPPVNDAWQSPSDLDTVSVGNKDSLNPSQQAALLASLREFIPWRKGPYSIAGINIDTEWRSDWKWRRLAKHIQPLAGRTVLDVGCGNGYHLWRMKAAGASIALGIDPTLLYLYQFKVVKHFTKAEDIHILPLRSEQLPPDMGAFDTVFSMGVLYHRREPEQHLLELMECLRPKGQLVLETLICPADRAIRLDAGHRYARMRNVWAIPTIDKLIAWLSNCGFKRVQVISENQTSTKEQRTTEWMPFESLQESLKRDDPNWTVEDLPAPRRAILCAERPL